jgi:hypothetical protein
MVRDGDTNRGGMRQTRPYIKETAQRAERETRRYLSQLRIQVEARRTLRLV